jgi:hypothetical protein
MHTFSPATFIWNILDRTNIPFKEELFPALFKLLSSCTNTLGNYKYISSTVQYSTVHCEMCTCTKRTSWPLTFYSKVVILCFVWIWEQTAIISLHNINWLVFITDGMCLLRGTSFIFKARCHGDSLRAGKSRWQVGYWVSLYCHSDWKSVYLPVTFGQCGKTLLTKLLMLPF